MGRWVRAERTPAATTATKKATLNLADHSELARLRRENEQLRMEREILKKSRRHRSERSTNKVRIYSRATEDMPCSEMNVWMIGHSLFAEPLGGIS
jgi:transposase-like protein